jgi:ABC-2 type transport system permease protein
MNVFRAFVQKEIFHILRDRRTLTILLLLPLVTVVLFGYAIRTDVKDIRVAIVDPAPDYATLELRNRLTAAGVFRVVAVLPNTARVDGLFQRRAAQQAIVFGPGFAEDLARGSVAHVAIITDATDPNSGSTMQAYAVAVLQAYEQELRETGSGVRIVPQTRMRFNPTLESSNLFVPGLIAFVLTIVSALMTSISLTREKELGTMEVLLVSPLKPAQIIIGKVVPYLGLGFINTLTTLTCAWLIFDVPFRGSVLLLIASCLLFTFTSLSLGILISTRTDSQQVAMMGALAGLMLPTMLLSGFIFPVESMPAPLRVISNIVPAKWFVLIARGIMLKGVGMQHLWQETLILAGMTVALLGISARNFTIRLEK